MAHGLSCSVGMRLPLDRQGFVPPLLLAAALASPVAAHAVSFGAGGGTEWSAISSGPSTSAVYAYGACAVPHVTFALGAVRYEDPSTVATGPLAVVIVPVVDALALRAWATHFAGNDGFHADRLRGGPEWTLPRDAMLGVYFTYLDNDRTGVFRTGGAEFEIPVRPHWTARANGSATLDGGTLTALQGAVGFGWSPVASVHFTVEAGLASRNAILVTSSPAGGAGGPHLLPLPLGGGGGAANRGELVAVSAGAEPTLDVGLRVALP